MIKIAFFILVLFFSFQIITKAGVQKLAWYFAGILFVPGYVVLIDSPHISFNKFLLYILLVVTFKDLKWYRAYRAFPYKWGIWIILLAYIIIGLWDDRVSFFYRIYRPLDFFFRDFFVLFLGWYYIRDKKDIRYIYNKFYLFFLIFSIYGICNFITGQNEFHTILSSLFDSIDFANANMEIEKERFRVSSFVDQAIYYGFIVGVVLLIEIYILTTIKLSQKEKIKHYILVILLIVNLLLTNSRTPLFSLVIGLGLYIMIALKMKQKILIILSVVLFFFSAMVISSNARTLIDKSLKTFSSEEESFQGSSIEMRVLQLGASVLIFMQNPVTGNGFNYITEGLGYSSDETERISEGALYGFESYVYKLLIEQGLVGIVANLLFFIILLRALLKMRKRVDYEGRQMVHLNIGLLCSFILFIVGTGDMGSFPFVMAIVGINTKLITLSVYRMGKQQSEVQMHRL